MKYPVYQPFFNGKEKEYVNDCMDSTWISSKGEYIEKFERQFADFIGVKYAATVSNGTVALHLALLALGIGEQDEVIVPTFTYIASVNAIVYCGATPVFADSEQNYWQMDATQLEKLITPRTKAIMPVHLYGHACDMEAICEVAKKHGLFVIEDCAEAIGTTIGNKKVGSFGDIAIFSFFGNKTITTGEGGMVVTNDETISERCNHLKGQGLAKHRQYWHDTIGYNYRMTNICAAIGVAQMETIDNVITKKRQIADWYKKHLDKKNIEFHAEKKGTTNTYWMCSILVKESKDRDLLRSHLETAQIETRPLFYPVHTMPMFSAKFKRFAVAENIGHRGLNLPSYPELTEQDVQFIATSVNSYFDK